jgi:hypothetical protein
MAFNYSINKIVNGKCEWCGTLATECEHYKNGQNKPLDEQVRLENPAYVPVYKNIAVEPLKESEKAASLAEAEAKMRTYAEETVLTQLAETEESLNEV